MGWGTGSPVVEEATVSARQGRIQGKVDRRGGNVAGLESPSFVSRKCYRQNWKGDRTVIGRSATTCLWTKKPGLGELGLLLTLCVRSPVAYARGSNGR